jgi:hypothetical protein
MRRRRRRRRSRKSDPPAARASRVPVIGRLSMYVESVELNTK